MKYSRNKWGDARGDQERGNKNCTGHSECIVRCNFSWLQVTEKGGGWVAEKNTQRSARKRKRKKERKRCDTKERTQNVTSMDTHELIIRFVDLIQCIASLRLCNLRSEEFILPLLLLISLSFSLWFFQWYLARVFSSGRNHSKKVTTNKSLVKQESKRILYTHGPSGERERESK